MDKHVAAARNLHARRSKAIKLASRDAARRQRRVRVQGPAGGGAGARAQERGAGGGPGKGRDAAGRQAPGRGGRVR